MNPWGRERDLLPQSKQRKIEFDVHEARASPPAKTVKSRVGFARLVDLAQDLQCNQHTQDAPEGTLQADPSVQLIAALQEWWVAKTREHRLRCDAMQRLAAAPIHDCIEHTSLAAFVSDCTALHGYMTQVTDKMRASGFIFFCLYT